MILIPILLIIAGAALLGSNLGYFELGMLTDYWPILLVIIGIYLIMKKDN